MDGTNTTLDTRGSRDASILDYGIERANEQIVAQLEVHNDWVRAMVADIAEWTTDRARRYGTVDTMEMIRTDEFGRPGVQKVGAGALVNFPLESYQVGWQGTRKYFANASMADLQDHANAVMLADRKKVVSRIKTAIFTPTNTTTYDHLVDNVPLAVKALANADSLGLPVGPNGEEFDSSTHTHYLGATTANTPAAADFVALADTVLEHYAGGDGFLYISRSLETAVKGFTSNFTPLTDIRIEQPYTSARVNSPGLAVTSVANRQIGYFNGLAVFVKPWIPTGYAFCFMAGAGKPVVLRERRAGSGQLVLNSDDERYPIKAQNSEREFEAAIWTRTNGAVLDTTHTTYAAPAVL
jgi:hypothetical protein